MRQNMIRTLGLATVALLFAGNASAYVLLSPARTWDCAPNVIVDSRGQSSISDGNGGVSATVNALNSNQAWNGAVSNVMNATAGSVSSYALGDGVPMLNFQDPIRACTGSCLAATFTGFYDQRGDGSYRIFDADIVTSGRYSWTTTAESDGCSSEFYMEGVQVHEVGHLLGIGHSNVTGSTMYPSVSSCNNAPASIESDDAAALAALYGNGSFPYCGTGGGGGGGGGGCDLGATGDSCTSNGDCCSNSCKGKPGQKTCK
jgi:hypothetical protein